MRTALLCRWQIYGFCAIFLVAGCSPTRNLSEDQRLLQEVRVVVNADEPEPLNVYTAVLRQQANSRFFGVRVPMRLNLLVSQPALYRSLERRKERGRSEGGFRWWLANRMGEAPVIYDEFLTDRSEKNLLSLARRRGFLDATCSVVKQELGSDRIMVEYQLELGKPWIISSWNWQVEGSGVEGHPLIASLPRQTGARLDVTELEKLRARLAADFREKGFPTIQSSHFAFTADSSNLDANRGVGVTGQILPLDWDQNGSPIPHRAARFGSVDWHCDISSDSADVCLDPELVGFLIALDSGMRFNETALQETYQRLTRLPSVGRVEIPGLLVPGTGAEDIYEIDLRIHLRKRFGFSSGIEMVRSDARYGPLVLLSLQDRNLSGKGDLWGVEMSGGLLSIKPFSYSEENIIPNSGTWSIKLNYSTAGIPPIDLARLRPSNQARTSLAANWMREIRPEYVREALGFNYSFELIENPARNSRLAIVPMELRYSDIDAKPEFTAWLDDQANPILSARFADYTSLLSRVEWTTDWGLKESLHGRFRTGIEWTGVGLDRWNRSRSGDDAETVYSLAGIPYAHYIRNESEWTVSTSDQFSSRASWNGRIKAGGALTGRNAEVIPFDRAFYAGGANGIRGWSVRDLGPGFASLDDEGLGVALGVGDVQLEASIEYRRKLTDALELAWFSDVGNVWLLPHDEADAAVTLSSKSMAWGCGLGVRLDFDFFLLRLDGAVRLHDPAQAESGRWIGSEAPRGRIHLGLGHAF